MEQVFTPNNLPQQLTSFVGRERDIAEVTRLLADTRLLTLTGAGGSGKTRLALQAATLMLASFPGGVWLVDLASLSAANLVPQAVASAIGVREEPGKSLAAVLAEHLRNRQTLLVLDNCEHLVEACATLVEHLLSSTIHLRILSTSREALCVAGEMVWPVLPLPAPDPRQDVPPDRLEQFEAVRLFIERAHARRPDFAVTSDNAHWVAQLCHSLDGIPLAIELAAARMKVLTVEQIASRIGERFHLLTSDSRTALPRQQTLQALMDWSYDILPESEQALFRGVSVFIGGFTLEALSAVSDTESREYETLDMLSRLVDKSLVLVEERNGQARYRLLETIRHYAREKAEAAGETPALQKLHRDYCLLLAGQSEDELLTERQSIWLERLEAEHDNLRAALRFSQTADDEAGDAEEAGLCLAGSLVWFWYFRGYVTEGREWLEAMLSQYHPSTTGIRAKALSAAGVLAFLQSDYSRSRAHLEEGLAIWKGLEDRRGTAFTLTFLARVLLRVGDVREARRLGEQSVTLFQQLDDRWGLALALDLIGVCAQEEGDYTQAAAFHDESLALYRVLGHRWGVALELSNFGRVALQQGNYALARARLEEALEMQREVGDKWIVAWTLHNLGDVARTEGDLERAESHYQEAMTLFRELADRGGTAHTLHMLGHIAERGGDTGGAEALLSESEVMFRELKDQPTYSRRAPATPWASGQPMTMSQALAFAFQDAADRSRHSGLERIEGGLRTESVDGESYPVELTKRELEVLRLIAAGLTDAQLAEQLTLSTRTVHAHVRSIYSKLGVNNRSAATRYAIEHGLV
jgi:non-specific serine/threonine protein kinase